MDKQESQAKGKGNKKQVKRYGTIASTEILVRLTKQRNDMISLQKNFPKYINMVEARRKKTKKGIVPVDWRTIIELEKSSAYYLTWIYLALETLLHDLYDDENPHSTRTLINRLARETEKVSGKTIKINQRLSYQSRQMEKVRPARLWLSRLVRHLPQTEFERS